jgi:neutral trehalase
MRAPLVTALLGGGSWLFTSLAATPLPAAVSSESDASRLLSADCAQCDVRILEVVHAARLFADDPKQFVDRPSRVPRAALLEETLLLRANGTSAEAVRRFVQQRFLSVGSDMLPASLPESETAPVPSWIARMQGMPAGEWTSWMRNEWSVLGRKYTVPEGACKDIGCVSFLPPPSAATGETFMVPGGRFRESYYWVMFHHSFLVSFLLPG